jgi:hypothetical protein
MTKAANMLNQKVISLEALAHQKTGTQHTPRKPNCFFLAEKKKIHRGKIIVLVLPHLAILN